MDIKPFKLKVNYGTDPLGLPIVRTFFITDITRQILGRDECRYFFTLIHTSTGTKFPLENDNVRTVEGLKKELKTAVLDDPPYSTLPRDQEAKIVDLTNKLLLNPVDDKALKDKERLNKLLQKGL